VKQLVKKYRKKNKKLYMVLKDLEKKYDRAPSKVLKWALMRKEVPEMNIHCKRYV